ncbi:MAG: endonuclease/exonuclease/phosphatase family protein [Myxococcota bacterium]
MSLILALSFPTDAHAQQPRNVRLVTYNAKQLGFPASTDGKFFDDSGNPLTNESRAQLLAQRILADGAEIVALQEVFDDDARRELYAALTNTYPTSVEYIGDDDDLSDSGLMLFSKHPFEPLSMPSEYFVEAGDAQITQSGLSSDTPGDLLAFTEFDCSGIDTDSDCAASKGAGLVRIALPMGESLVVVFTHTRATYDDDSEADAAMKVAERRDALSRIDKMVTAVTVAVEGDPLDAHVVVLGDLNIDGNPDNTLRWPVLDAEWGEAFSSSSLVPFTGCADLPGPACRGSGRVLVDAWAFTTSPDDLGRTAGFSFVADPADRSDPYGERLDYVLVRGPVGPGVVDPVVPQHLSIAWGLAGKTGALSDHLPVAVDLLLPGDNGTAVHSTPADAAPADLSFTGDAAAVLELAHPGQMQWVKVEDTSPGTYTVRSSDPGVGFEVYAATDLSRPIEPRRAVVDGGGWVYVLPAPPYYVRTFAVVPGSQVHDRSATGPYTLWVHEHRCASPTEACILTAGDVDGFEVEWPAATAVNPEDSMYFEFYADDPDVQYRPVVHQFEIERRGATADLPRLVFEALDDRGWLPLPDVRWTDLSLSGDRLVREAEKVFGNPGSTPSYAAHLLRVTRDPADFGWGGVVAVHHRTNLTYFTPLTLTVLQEEDASAHDELRIYLAPVSMSPFHDFVDGDSVHFYASEFTPLPQIDELEDGGSPWPAGSLGSRRLTDELPLLMIEDDDEDGTPEGGDFRFAEPHPSGGLGTWTGRALALLPLDRPAARAVWSFTDDPGVVPDLTDYSYVFIFDVSHTPPCFTRCE